MSFLINEIRLNVGKKEKRAKVSKIFAFFPNKMISKVTKDINYKIK